MDIILKAAPNFTAADRTVRMDRAVGKGVPIGQQNAAVSSGASTRFGKRQDLDQGGHVVLDIKGR